MLLTGINLSMGSGIGTIYPFGLNKGFDLKFHEG